jgi:hypothetical protein
MAEGEGLKAGYFPDVFLGCAGFATYSFLARVGKALKNLMGL